MGVTKPLTKWDDPPSRERNATQLYWAYFFSANEKTDSANDQPLKLLGITYFKRKNVKFKHSLHGPLAE